jgi:hypothetical protein
VPAQRRGMRRASAGCTPPAEPWHPGNSGTANTAVIDPASQVVRHRCDRGTNTQRPPTYPDRSREGDRLSDGVDEHVVGYDQCGEAIWAVLSALPSHRLLLQVVPCPHELPRTDSEAFAMVNINTVP